MSLQSLYCVITLHAPHVLLEEVFVGHAQVLRGHRAIAAAGNTRLEASTLFLLAMFSSVAKNVSVVIVLYA